MFNISSDFGIIIIVINIFTKIMTNIITEIIPIKVWSMLELRLLWDTFLLA